MDKDGFESDRSGYSQYNERNAQSSLLTSTDSVLLNSDIGEDGATSAASDFDFDDDNDVEMEFHAEEPASKKTKVGRVRRAQNANKRALAVAGRVKSLPAWHSSTLVSKHPMRAQLETCSACLSSFVQEKLYIRRDARLTSEQKEMRLQEVDRLIEESYWNSKRVYARNRHLHQCALQSNETRQKAASRYNSHLERHRVYSKNWAERTKPVQRSTSILDGEDGESSVTDGDYGDDSYYGYGSSEGYDDKHNAGYSFDALTAAALEAANDSAFDDVYSSSQCGASQEGESSEDLPPLTPDTGGFASSMALPDGQDSMLPHRYIPSAVWEILEFEEQLVKGIATAADRETLRTVLVEGDSSDEERITHRSTYSIHAPSFFDIKEPIKARSATPTLGMFAESQAVQV